MRFCRINERMHSEGLCQTIFEHLDEGQTFSYKPIVVSSICAEEEAARRARVSGARGKEPRGRKIKSFSAASAPRVSPP